tara:strand:+ start:326 stop:1771 length:1446 start_codon:yes stop_codon:yes gene_type:complete
MYKFLLFSFLFTTCFFSYSQDVIFGCTDENACNYNQEALFEDGSCVYPDLEAGVLNQISDLLNFGYYESIDTNTNNFFQQGTDVFTQGTSMFVQGTNVFVQGTDLMFSTFSILGDELYDLVINLFQTIDTNPEIIDCEPCISDLNNNGICDEFELNAGCTNNQASNFNELSSYNDGSCIYSNLKPFYYNYSCEILIGLAVQSDIQVNVNGNYFTIVDFDDITLEIVDGTITPFSVNGLISVSFENVLPGYVNYSGFVNGNQITLISEVFVDFGSGFEYFDTCYKYIQSSDNSVIFGCMDSQACDYNEYATHSNGSCEYFDVNFDIDTLIENGIYTLVSDPELEGYSYTWYFNEQIIPNETNNSLVASQNGFYELVINNPTNYCEGSNSVELFNVFIEEKELSTFTVYPNPAKDFILISFESKELVQIEISNAIGELIKYWKPMRLYSNEFKLPTSEFKPGSYFITIRNGDVSKTKKVFIIE